MSGLGGLTERKWLNPENIISLPHALFRAAENDPERTALDYFGKKISYEKLAEMVKIFAGTLKEFDCHYQVEKNHRVALLLPNIPQFAIAYYGAHLAGKTAIPVNFSSIAKELKTKPVKEIKITEEITAQLTDSEPDVIVVADFFRPILKQIKSKLRSDAIFITASPADFLPFPLNKLYCLKAMKEGKYVRVPKNDVNEFHFKDLLKQDIGRHNLMSFSFPDINDFAQFQYTGGTTGTPKGAMLTHGNVMINALQCREHLDDFLKQGEVVLGVLPFFHSYGLTACLNMTLLTLEGTLILMPSFTPKEALHLIEKKKVTLWPGVNRMFQVTADYPDVEKYDLSSLKTCFSGAGALHQTVKEKFEKKTGALIVEGYGLSEASPVVSITHPMDKKAGTIGRPVPLTKVKIVDVETGAELGVGQDGEIAVAGPQVMKGYYNKPEETAQVIKDGWLHTGDIGHIDPDGCLFITDREKDMIKILGENVYPREIEEYLLKNPKVKKCVVIGAPDMKKGEAPVAFVVLENGTTAEDLRKYAAAAPHNLWTPREIREIPETQFSEWEDILGKVKRRKIRQYYKENFGK